MMCAVRPRPRSRRLPKPDRRRALELLASGVPHSSALMPSDQPDVRLAATTSEPPATSHQRCGRASISGWKPAGSRGRSSSDGTLCNHLSLIPARWCCGSESHCSSVPWDWTSLPEEKFPSRASPADLRHVGFVRGRRAATVRKFSTRNPRPWPPQKEGCAIAVERTGPTGLGGARDLTPACYAGLR
jgi:hypothetical protein